MTQTLTRTDRDAVAASLLGRPSQPTARLARPGVRVALAATLAALACLAYLLVGLTGNLAFALELRAWRVATVVVVGCAVAAATVLFHTVTNNRILTPGIMGFDALYLFVLTTVQFTFGLGGLVQWPPLAQFGLHLLVMVGFGTLLFRWMFDRGSHDLHLLLMVGLVVGTMLRSGAAFMQRLLEPSEFQVLQDFMFASFGRPDHSMVLASAALVAVTVGVPWWSSRVLDVLALGRPQAISLGVDHHRATSLVLVAIIVLVSTSTALVGPIVFLGLLVANLAYLLAGTHRHAVTLPIAMCLSVAVLAVSQLLSERVFGFSTSTGIIVEFVGGATFLVLLLRRREGIR